MEERKSAPGQDVSDALEDLDREILFLRDGSGNLLRSLGQTWSSMSSEDSGDGHNARRRWCAWAWDVESAVFGVFAVEGSGSDPSRVKNHGG